MRKSIFTGVTVLAVLAGVASLMFSATASARPAVTFKKVTIAMHDPGCHWFVSGPADNRTWSLSTTKKGPVQLLNLDENTLIVVYPNSTTKNVLVGKTLKLKAKGAYSITMLDMAADDNTLALTIK